MALIVYMEFVDPEDCLSGTPDRLLLAYEMFERYANLLEIKEGQNKYYELVPKPPYVPTNDDLLMESRENGDE